ncbi:hypothetical protein Goarm_010227 [Gossypium armourianum]|uniref:Uncharacterized protein n=1 Tax=Gossypium armourianum TaxID=34283 RepID=A0A7J9JVF2_9ROSI|nr:hypothetical protein [Gossypium armourianum]
MGHGAKDCEEISVKDSEDGINEFPYSTTLREESTLVGKECLQFGENPPIVETAVYHQNLGDLVAPLFLKIMEDTMRGELSKEIIETDMKGE